MLTPPRGAHQQNLQSWLTYIQALENRIDKTKALLKKTQHDVETTTTEYESLNFALELTKTECKRRRRGDEVGGGDEVGNGNEGGLFRIREELEVGGKEVEEGRNRELIGKLESEILENKDQAAQVLYEVDLLESQLRRLQVQEEDERDEEVKEKRRDGRSDNDNSNVEEDDGRSALRGLGESPSSFSVTPVNETFSKPIGLLPNGTSIERGGQRNSHSRPLFEDNALVQIEGQSTMQVARVSLDRERSLKIVSSDKDEEVYQLENAAISEAEEEEKVGAEEEEEAGEEEKILSRLLQTFLVNMEVEVESRSTEQKFKANLIGFKADISDVLSKLKQVENCSSPLTFTRKSDRVDSFRLSASYGEDDVVNMDLKKAN